MPKVVLLPVSGIGADADIFATALSVGRLFDCHFVALHTRPDVRRDIASLAATDGAMTIGIDSMLQRMDADADKHEQAALASWKSFCEQNNIAMADHPGTHGMTAEWVGETGAAADYVAAHGRVADMVIVGRGEEAWGPDYDVMEAALMETGKPVIIAPRVAGAVTASPGDVVGIAWKDRREAAGAVRAALPFIDKAKQVLVFTVTEGENDDKSHLRLIRMLRWHNSNITVRALATGDAAPAAILCDAAEKSGCGLLVMGGYGHARLREAVFGGFTRAILADAPLPVLMVH
jgi:nucleotide-binding universal stress UspA family protein